MMQRDLGKLVRQGFVGLLAASQLAGCGGQVPASVDSRVDSATKITVSNRASSSPARVLPEGDWVRHQKSQPAGEDYQKGYGSLVSAPASGQVYYSDPDRTNTHIIIITPMGYLVDLACHSKLHVSRNSKVTPLDIIAEEGSDCPKGGGGRADESHVHVSVYKPNFATLLREQQKAKGYVPFLWRSAGLELFLDNPGKYGMADKMFNGDDSINEKILSDARTRLFRIAEEHPKSLLAMFIDEAKKDPDVTFDQIAMAAYNMWNNKVLGPGLHQKVEDYLRWHLDAPVVLFAPYANPELLKAGKYRVQGHDPDLTKKLTEKWRPIRDLWDKRRYNEALPPLLEFRKHHSQISGTSRENSLGIIFLKDGEYRKSFLHLTLAEAQIGYKPDSVPAETKWRKYWINANMSYVLARLGRTEAEFYLARSEELKEFKDHVPIRY